MAEAIHAVLVNNCQDLSQKKKEFQGMVEFD